MFILNLFNRAAFYKLFALSSNNIMEVIPWQFFTYIFSFDIGVIGVIFFGFKILILLWFCSALESLWGSLRFLIFLLIAILSRSISSFLIGPLPLMGDNSLYLCLMVAFGFNFPDNIIYVFIIPVRVKILAIISLCFVPVLMYFDMSNSLSFSGGMFYFPMEAAIIVTNLLSYSALLFYFNRIFSVNKLSKMVTKMKDTKMENETKKMLSSISDKNKKYADILNRKKNGTLNEDDKKILSELSDENVVMCDEVDFDEDENYCKECTKFGNCVKREINGNA
jgi:hypothetical protein